MRPSSRYWHDLSRRRNSRFGLRPTLATRGEKGGLIMAYWLMKTEPEEFSWDDQVKRGAKGEPWSGVRNFTARRYLKEMKKGEKFFFYHTGDEKQVIGIGEVLREAYPDPTAKAGEPWVAVTTAAVEPLPKPVPL